MIDLSRETVMDVSDVAATFRVSDVTVRRWFKRGCWHFKIGGCIRTTKSAVEQFAGLSEVPASVPRGSSVDKDTREAMKQLANAGYAVG